MNALRLALGFLVGIALLDGCNGSQPPIGAPGAMPQSRAIAQHAARGKSWMLPEARSQDLLYVSDASATVSVYTFPTLRKVGSFGLSNTSAGGECGDNVGNVFITTANADRVGTIYEYSHGGSSPVAALSDPGLPYGCAVDPASGNLAVSNFYDASNPSQSGLGDVAVYDHAQGSPTMYQSSTINYLLYCTFDNSGNLFADGADGDGVHALFEVADGSKSITEISLGPAVRSLGSLQWDGAYLTIADYNSNIHKRLGPQAIDRLQISNGSAKVVSSTSLSSRTNRHSGQSWIQRSAVIGIINNLSTGLAIWKYPSGGKPTRQIGKAGSRLVGVTVSLAPHR